MKFRTEISSNPAQHKITYDAGLFFLGSCFSENIFKKTDYYKFNTTSNPFGILYNPAAIETIISKALDQHRYTEDELFFLNERWHCFDSHSDLSSPNKETLLQNLNNALANTAEQLKTASHIIITLGTAWVYKQKENDTLVGNCHKVPQREFEKSLLSTTEIHAILDRITTRIKASNPQTKFLFTVSPVRHLKDGFVENTRSKSHLITAIHELVDNKQNCHYFPAFEIVNDDLRDYRFYAEDLVHPNTVAIAYIWEKFTQAWLADSCTPIMKKVAFVQKGLAHRPFNPNAEAHQIFLKKIEDVKSELKAKNNIDWN